MLTYFSVLHTKMGLMPTIGLTMSIMSATHFSISGPEGGMTRYADSLDNDILWIYIISKRVTWSSQIL
ncbi:unnamed protein product [Ranitomeya imitator]|uniref:Cytochrome c oxidase subunit 1 n=1 Tax=Ranitomeya imitator TaxID=111125 RepID=A0ABN9MBI0_9NEOB|nr:unnamed protein product [Ranitomeya imitator]